MAVLTAFPGKRYQTFRNEAGSLTAFLSSCPLPKRSSLVSQICKVPTETSNSLTRRVSAEATDSANLASYPPGKIKKNIRVFVDQNFVPGESVPLSHLEMRHLRARRVRNGDHLLLFNDAGDHASAVYQTSHALILDASCNTSDTLALSAIVALPKIPSRADWVVEKLTEMGAASIFFCATARSESRLVPSKLNRWHRLAISAAKQSLRTDLPKISLLTFEEVVRIVQQSPAPLLFTHGGQPLLARPCVDLVSRSSSALLLVGPEGGFEEAEITQLSDAGAIKVGLGRRRLRVETAAVLGAAVVSQLLVHHDGLLEKENIHSMET